MRTLANLVVVSSLLVAIVPVISDHGPDNSTLGNTEGPWSVALEDWAVGHSDRENRILHLPNTSGYYISNRVDSTPQASKPSGSWSQEYNPSTPPGKIVNSPQPPPYYSNAYQQRPTHANYQSGPGPASGFAPTNMNPYNGANPSNVQSSSNRKEVSETDLYLLGAIEKLVYRVDFMEKRLKKAEELIYYLMAGNNKKSANPCSKNFTRVGSNCYYFSTDRIQNWKAASDACKTMGAALAEMETIEENQDVVNFIQATTPLRGKDFWTGGLNPGLLWIWSNSARPVSTGNKDEQQLLNSATNPGNISDIKGNGRCLKLAYSPTLRTYSYLGHDCSQRHNYICEVLDKTLSNEISRISRELKLEF